MLGRLYKYARGGETNMASKIFQITDTDEKNILILREHGYTNLSKVIRDLLAQKAEQIQNGIEDDQIISNNGSVRLLDNTLIIHNGTLAMTQPIAVTLGRAGRLWVNPDTKDIHIKLWNNECELTIDETSDTDLKC